MGAHSDKWQDGGSNEAVIRSWLFHYLRDRLEGIDRGSKFRLETLLSRINNKPQKQYALKRLVEMMREIDANMIILYHEVEKKLVGKQK